MHVDIRLANQARPDLDPVDARALVDTGTSRLCISKDLCQRLGLEQIERRDVETADEDLETVPYVGPLRIEVEDRTCVTGALILGDEVILGAAALAELQLMVDPAKERLIADLDAQKAARAIDRTQED